MSSAPTLNALLAAAPEAARKDLIANPALGARLAQRVAELDPRPAFAAFVGGKLSGSPPLARGIEAIRVDDLSTVFHCIEQNPAAILALEKTLKQQIASEARRLGVPGSADDACQRILQQLLVARGGEAVIAQYSGRGDLAAWLRMIAVRELLRLKKAGRASIAADDSALSDLVAGGDDPELGLLRNQFKAEFRAAFADAVAALTGRERTLLRQHFIEAMSIDEIAALHSVHRATAARWVAKAKEAVSEATQRMIRDRSKIGGEELDSLLRLVRSRLEISLRLLKIDEEK